MEKASYSSIRSDIESGDIIAVRDNSFISNIIRIFSRQAYSHVALAWRDGRHVMLIEAHANTGIRIRPLSAAVNGDQVLRLISIEKKYWNDEIEDYALKSWGTPYSYLNCILAGLGLPLTNKGRWQCTEFCNIILNLGGLNINCPSLTPGALVEELLLHGNRMIEITTQSDM